MPPCVYWVWGTLESFEASELHAMCVMNEGSSGAILGELRGLRAACHVCYE
jgi:hypothetical protein